MTAGTREAQVFTVKSKDGTPIGLWKTGSGPALLAVHGTAADHTAWDSVAPLLADSFTVFAIDRRGRGASGDGADYSIDREFDDVAAAVDAVGGPVHLYGNSFGGTCAAEAALRTRNLGRLILYEGGPKPAGLSFIPDDFIVQLEQLIASGNEDEAVSTFMLKSAGVAPGVPRELRAINDYGANVSKIATIAAPTLLLVGSETEARRREMFEGLARVLPNAQVTVLPGQRHAAHQTAPQLFAAAIREFLLEA